MRTLVLGGIRSGKSEYAEALLATAPQVCYVATGVPRSNDPEWSERIRGHQRRRPADWRTVECGDRPRSLPRLLRDAAAGDAVLVDDLGGWVVALHDTAGWREPMAEPPLRELIDAVRDSPADVILVSPEVGLTVVPENLAARRFADALGTVNRKVADACAGVVLLVAGQPLWIKGTLPTSLTP
jgi:adenosyl cobinamide kinase/adenosyl cobinamide phosphate guanylyltransferase